ncbi:MAG: hypothetical protein GY862_32215, partial [Gammaproteobacteria bacterium]|nr:hypothetical protein [Gammaproteobacteria bacterium]
MNIGFFLWQYYLAAGGNAKSAVELLPVPPDTARLVLLSESGEKKGPLPEFSEHADDTIAAAERNGAKDNNVADRHETIAAEGNKDLSEDEKTARDMQAAALPVPKDDAVLSVAAEIPAKETTPVPRTIPAHDAHASLPERDETPGLLSHAAEIPAETTPVPRTIPAHDAHASLPERDETPGLLSRA